MTIMCQSQAITCRTIMCQWSDMSTCRTIMCQWSDMSTCRTIMCQWSDMSTCRASTIKDPIKHVCLVQNWHCHHFIEFKLFSLWYCWKGANLELKQQLPQKTKICLTIKWTFLQYHNSICQAVSGIEVFLASYCIFP
jgi:hypothetical protein